MMVAVSTFETSMNFYETTQCNIPEDSYFYSPPREPKISQRVLIKQENER
jgi:hypothetical protein